MKIRFNRHVTSALGQVVVLDDGKTKATLGDIAAVALGKFSQKDLRNGIEPGVSSQRGLLAARVREAKGEADLKAEEVVLVKNCIEAYWPPEIVGPAWLALDEGK